MPLRHYVQVRFVGTATWPFRLRRATPLTAACCTGFCYLGIAPPVDRNTDPALARSVDQMLDQGWRRPSGPFNEFKKRLWTRNQEFILKLLI